MTDLIEKIGPIVGVVAFLGLAILAFLIFQQAREVRRLREWAGRAPERAAEAAEATAAAAEARGDTIPDEEPDLPPESEGRFAQWRAGVRERFAPAWAELDRRSPVDPRYFVVVLAAAIVAAGVLTSGFGLLGGDDGGDGRKGGGNGRGSQEPDRIEVSVLNATQELDVNNEVIPGVPGLADDIAKEVVKPAGYAIGAKDDARSGFDRSTIFFEQGSDGDANELAEAVSDDLGETEVEPMIDDVEALADGAPLVLVVGRDDADALGEPAG